MYFQLAEDQERLQELLALQEDIEDEEEELYKVNNIKKNYYRISVL